MVFLESFKIIHFQFTFALSLFQPFLKNAEPCQAEKNKRQYDKIHGMPPFLQNSLLPASPVSGNPEFQAPVRPGF
jgi:hypothetical protein